MSKKRKLRVCNFTKYLNSLYEDVDSYIDGTLLHRRKEQIELCQQKVGKYTVDKFTLFDENNKRVAEFLPVAALIVGGAGMVDFKGRFSIETLTYHEEYDRFCSYDRIYSPDKPNRKNAETDERDFKPGWYWTEISSPREANSFNEDIFIELMKMISDYEFE